MPCTPLDLISLCRDRRLGGEVRQTWARLHPAGEGFHVTQLPGTMTGQRPVSLHANSAGRGQSGQL